MAENILTKQVAGIPVGAWGVVVAGGLGIAYMLNKGANRAETSQEPLVEPGVGTGLVPAGAAFVPSDSSQQDTGPENNQAWGQQALNWLITQGHNATVADNAIRKYLVGETLTLQENALVGLALAKFGAPPEALPPTTVPPIPPPASEPVGAPALTIDQPNTRTLRAPVHITVRGRVTIGGQAPGTIQLIKYTAFATNGSVYGTTMVASNTNGDFTAIVGFSAKGTRKYQFEWRGNKIVRYISVT
jgi:hypothetical protein